MTLALALDDNDDALSGAEKASTSSAPLSDDVVVPIMKNRVAAAIRTEIAERVLVQGRRDVCSNCGDIIECGL